MKVAILILLGSLVSTGTLVTMGLYYGLKNNVRGSKFTALGMFNFSVSCAIILYYDKSRMSLSQIKDLGIAASVFLILSALFYWSYQIVKTKSNEEKG